MLIYVFSERVRDGIFENESIMTHIGQNLFIFVFTTLAWFTFSQVFSLTASTTRTRYQRALSLAESADQVLAALGSFEYKY